MPAMLAAQWLAALQLRRWRKLQANYRPKFDHGRGRRCRPRVQRRGAQGDRSCGSVHGHRTGAHGHGLVRARVVSRASVLCHSPTLCVSVVSVVLPGSPCAGDPRRTPLSAPKPSGVRVSAAEGIGAPGVSGVLLRTATSPLDSQVCRRALPRAKVRLCLDALVRVRANIAGDLDEVRGVIRDQRRKGARAALGRQCEGAWMRTAQMKRRLTGQVIARVRGGGRERMVCLCGRVSSLVCACAWLRLVLSGTSARVRKPNTNEHERMHERTAGQVAKTCSPVSSVRGGVRNITEGLTLEEYMRITGHARQYKQSNTGRGLSVVTEESAMGDKRTVWFGAAREGSAELVREEAGEEEEGGKEEEVK